MQSLAHRRLKSLQEAHGELPDPIVIFSKSTSSNYTNQSTFYESQAPKWNEGEETKGRIVKNKSCVFGGEWALPLPYL